MTGLISALLDLKKLARAQKRLGFTLIEMIVVLFFAGIIIVVLFNLYDWHARVYAYQQALVRVSASNREAVETMQSYVSQATQVLATSTINSTLYTTSANTLVLQLPSIDSSGAAISGKWDKCVFYPSGNNFYLRVEADAFSSRQKLYKNLSDTLLSANFTYNNANVTLATEITVNFQSQVQVKQQQVQNTLQQDMYLLNF